MRTLRSMLKVVRRTIFVLHRVNYWFVAALLLVSLVGAQRCVFLFMEELSFVRSYSTRAYARPRLAVISDKDLWRNVEVVREKKDVAGRLGVRRHNPRSF